MYPESYTPNSGSYDDVWRGTPDMKHHVPEAPRSPLELNVNPYPVTTIEFEPVPNVFTFSPCTPPYK